MYMFELARICASCDVFINILGSNIISKAMTIQEAMDMYEDYRIEYLKPESNCLYLVLSE